MQDDKWSLRKKQIYNYESLILNIIWTQTENNPNQVS